MNNLRVQVEKDGVFTYGSKSQWGLPVELVAPDGKIQKNPVIDGELDLSDTLKGQVIYDTLSQDPDTGAEIIVHKPVVTLRISELERVPKAGEKWTVKIPTYPNPEAPKSIFFIERPSEDGQAIGFIRLYLVRLKENL